VAGVITAFAVACTSIATPGTEEAPSSSAVARTRRDRSAACALPPTVLRRIWRGTRSDASGDIQIVTAEPDYVGGGLSHAGPWDYVQRVPLFLYGPGRVPPSGRIERSATLADIAPTLAAMLGFDFEAPDGRVLESALAPTAGQDPPRLLVTLVWDGAGRNVLDHWTGRWPFLSGLIADGVWFERAEVGSSPSNTPPSHATIGTGAFPRRHGVVDLFQHVDGEIVKPQEAGPHTLLVPTLADLYDADRDNEPLVGVIGTLGTHTGMVGHGSGWPGGDADIAVMRELEDAVTGGAEGDIWQLTTGMTPYFQMPPYVNEVPGMEPELDALDREDGVVDRAWGEHAFDALEDGFQTPARSPYQTRIVEEIVAREGFGVDDVPDLLFVNLKAADSVGHLFGVGSAEMGATVRWLDSALEDLVGFLDSRVGRGEWVMTLTADHGMQLHPKASGALAIGVADLTRFIDDRFAPAAGRPVVRRVRPTHIWVNERRLAESGHSLDDVVAWLARATRADLSGGAHPAGDPRAPAFAAVFPTSDLHELDCLPNGRS
jgi:hypothetical protein